MMIGNVSLLQRRRITSLVYLAIYVENALLHNSFLYKIYLGTTQILLTINGNHTATIPWAINATSTGRNLVSYRYQSKAYNYQCQINGHNPQPVYQNREPQGYNFVIYQGHFNQWVRSH